MVRRFEDFGVLAQRQGAKAVVASLWPVADEGTRLLVQKSYARRNASALMLKSEALRQAQLDLLNGKETTGKSSQERQLVREQKSKAGGHDFEALFKFDPKAPYAHPYYWAPFILIGNWK